MRFEDPMVFVGEVEQLAGNAKTLKDIKCPDPLRLRYSEVQRPMDHQHRCSPVLDIVYRIVFFIAFRIIPRRSDMVPLWKPEFLGVEIRHALVEAAIVVDQTAKAVGPIPGDPVNHITPKGGA